MKIRRQNRFPARSAHDWVCFVISRISGNFPPIRDRPGLTPFPGRLSYLRFVANQRRVLFPNHPARGLIAVSGRLAVTPEACSWSSFAGRR